MKIGDFKNVAWKEGGQYVAQSLNVDVSSFGGTKREAMENLREALELYVEDESDQPMSTVEAPEIVTV